MPDPQPKPVPKPQDDKPIDSQAEIERLTNSLARTQADFENFRKRQAETQENFLKFANSQLILEILPVIDNFHRAFQHIPENLKNDQWVTGVLAIEKQFLQTLEKLGVQKIETTGKKADPKIHEIISAIEKEKTEKDTIVEEIEAGYLLNGKVLRPAKVMVQK